GVMPSHEHLSDAELAAILNHVLTSFGNEDRIEAFEPYAPADIAARRGQMLMFTDVYAERQQLGPEGARPASSSHAGSRRPASHRCARPASTSTSTTRTPRSPATSCCGARQAPPRS